MTLTLDVSKYNVYVSQQREAGLKSSKVNTYVVQQRDPGQKASKVNTYVTEQTKYGVFYQTDASKKPVYREAPTGGIAYFDMSATDAEFLVSVPFADAYTFIVYYADETFGVIEQDLTAGENTVPITDDFNQACMLRGDNIHRYVVNSIKEGMKVRAS